MTCCSAQAEYVLKFATASNCAKQMSIVKEAYEDPHAFAFLADVLFVCPLKHPVRGIVTRYDFILLPGFIELFPIHAFRLFSNAECVKRSTASHTKEILLSALRGALRQLAMSISNSSVNADDINDVFVSVSACLHSFPFGRDALAQEIYCFIPLVPKALRLYWMSLR